MDLKQHLKPHAILIPLPLQGHINPFTHLAMKLASKGFTITFVNTEATHKQIATSQSLNDDNNPFSHAQNSGLDIRYARINDGFPLSFDRRANESQFMKGLTHVFQAHVDDFIENLVLSKPNPPSSCMITDSFHVWGSMIAKKYNLVNVSFWTEPATVLTISYHTRLLKSNGHFGCHDKYDDIIRYIPGIQAIKTEDLPSYCQELNQTARYVFKCIEDAKKAEFVIGNTVQELESSTISALQKHQPFYAIGPVFPISFNNRLISTSLLPESDYTNWLNNKQDGTVLYISFGSLASLSKQDILEIAQGIMISNVSFIWVLRRNIIVSQEPNIILPIGFEEETADRGLVVPWCSQLQVLSHRAVGGFLTHCGWNSIVESIWCNVPMVCFPVFADQLTNRKLVVDDWRIGVNLCTRGLIRRMVVAENIGKVMSKSDELKENIEKTKTILHNAVSDEGSSEKNLNQFIQDMKNKILQKK